jgi:hypothetical protein
MTQYPIKATHAILVGGLPRFLEFEQGAELTTALILPGDLVEFTSPPTDCTVKAGQADSTTILGVANIHPVGAVTPPRGGTRTVAYAAGDSIEIINGPITVMLRIATSADIQCGEFVQPAASGEVTAYICGTDNDCQRIAQALETNTADTQAFQWGLFQLRMG